MYTYKRMKKPTGQPFDNNTINNNNNSTNNNNKNSSNNDSSNSSNSDSSNSGSAQPCKDVHLQKGGARPRGLEGFPAFCMSCFCGCSVLCVVQCVFSICCVCCLFRICSYLFISYFVGGGGPGAPRASVGLSLLSLCCYYCSYDCYDRDLR